MPETDQNVSKIHNKYTVTLFTPSSYYVSLAASIALVSAIAGVSHIWYGIGGADGLPVYIIASLAALAATQAIDSRLIRNKEYSKSLHMSLFGNTIWMLALLSGTAAAAVFSLPAPGAIYIGIGMFVFAGFRVGILTTTLGVGAMRAWAMCMVQPLAVFLAMVPAESWHILYDPVVIGYGAAFIIVAAVWSHLTDRAGMPVIKSTHRLIQAYLSSRGEDLEEIESVMEGYSRSSQVTTSQLRLKSQDGSADVRLVLPDIHPGPYHPVGGSNIPYLIYRALGSQAMVMHSISNHSQNLPSKQQVQSYLEGLQACSASGAGPSCTEPISIQVNRARCVGMLFGKSAMLLLSLSPHGMEDLPSSIKSSLERHGAGLGYDRVLLVDCHNAMGQEISGPDSQDLERAAKSCLDALIAKEAGPMEIGYANSDSMGISVQDLGMGGLGVLCLRVSSVPYYIGWADSNNMQNGVREQVVERLAEKGYNMLEICTSDTHFSQKMVRTRQGYYQFGLITPGSQIASWYEDLAARAASAAGAASYEILEGKISVQVMGTKIFDDFTGAVENSVRITKMFAAGCAALFFTSLFL